MTMVQVVLDASVILAIMQNETISDSIEEHLSRAMISTINACEILTKLINKAGMTLQEATTALAGFRLQIVPFNHNHFQVAAELSLYTRKWGLSMGDRACLALAKAESLPVLTADQIWSKLDIGIDIRMIR